MKWTGRRARGVVPRGGARDVVTLGVVTFGVIVAAGAFAGCRRMSESVRDETAGMNGGFEVVRSGLPVNWLVYTPKTLPTGDYDLVVDTTEHHGGHRSLRFVVRACSPDGGWRSPGVTWTHYEHRLTVPPGFTRIRLEVNVLRPGTFWIDDISIGGIS